MIKTLVSGLALLYQVSLAGSVWADEIQENIEIILGNENYLSSVSWTKTQ